MFNEPALLFDCSDGHKMPVYQWLPESCKAIVIIVHGLAEHATRYGRFAAKLNTAGIGVFAADLRGHGRAVTSEAMLGITGDDWANRQVRDMYELVLFLEERFPALPVFLMGHSMGSFIAQRFAQLHGNYISGLLLSGTNGFKDPLLPAGVLLTRTLMKWKGPSFKSKLVKQLTFGKFNNAFKPVRTRFDWLSRDNKEVDAYIADPLCGFTASVQLAYHLFVLLQITFSKKEIDGIRKDLPVYAFAGDKDPVGMQGKGFMKLIANWKAAGINNIEYKLYKDGRHEMLNEINREEVMTDCLNWLVKQL